MKKLDIIYYHSLGEVSRYIDEHDVSRNSSVVDDASFNRCLPILHIEQESYEEACHFIFDRIDQATSPLEKALVYEALFSHYPMLMRYVNVFDQMESMHIVCFIAYPKMNVYHLAFQWNYETCYSVLEKGEIQKTDLHQIVYFYGHEEVSASIVDEVFQAYFPTVQSESTESQGKRILFIATDNEYNLYLKPIYPIIDELQKRSLPFDIYATTEMTARFLDTHEYPYYPFFATQGISPEDLSHETLSAVAQVVYTETPQSLYEYMLNLALNSSTLVSVLRSCILMRSIDVDQYSDVFFVPDGGPIPFYISLCLRDHVRTHTVIAASVSEHYRTIVYYLANTIYCYGLECAEVLRAKFPEKTYILSGHPTLYRFQKYVREPVDHKVILVATSGYDPEETVWMEALLRHVDSSACRIEIKPHPMYPEKYESLRSSLGGHVLIDALEDIEVHIVQSDIVITDHSQVGRDAHLLGKHVISMALTQPILHLNDIDSIHYCRDIENLCLLVQKLLTMTGEVFVDNNFIKNYNAGNTFEHYKTIVDHVMKSS